MLKNGNYKDAMQLAFGIKRKCNLFEIHLRFTEDIANCINERLTADNLFITNTSNKGCRTIYGHCTKHELEIFDRVKRIAMGNRLIQQGLAMMPD
jgi:hypothetical protein